MQNDHVMPNDHADVVSKSPHMLRFLDVANGLTIASLVSSLASAALAINGHTGQSIIALIVAGICDLFDGLVARRLKRDEERRKFGSALDSIVDGCAFGFAPSLFLYCAGLNSVPEMFLLAALPICVVWRVAYFDVVGLQTEKQAKYYTGLPATYVALVLPLVSTLGFVDATWFRWGNAAAVVVLCLAMTSSVSVRKPSGIAYIFFLLLAVGVTTALICYGSLLPTSMRN